MDALFRGSKIFARARPARLESSASHHKSRVKDRSFSSSSSSTLFAVVPARVQSVLVDIRPLDAIESKPELVESFLHRCTHHRLLGLTDGIAFNRKRPDLHVLFVHAHMECPIANVFGFGIEAVVPRQAVDDPRHALVGGALETKTLTGIKLEPAALIHQKLTPVEKRRGLG